MNAAHATHPSLEQLTAFRLGKIGPPELGDIERHVSECDACCHTMRTLPDDTFIGLLRDCDPSAPFRSDTDAQQACRHETPTCTHLSSVLAQFPELPAELARHERYRVLELAAAGGMAAVYEAEAQAVQRRVA